MDAPLFFLSLLLLLAFPCNCIRPIQHPDPVNFQPESSPSNTSLEWANVSFKSILEALNMSGLNSTSVSALGWEKWSNNASSFEGLRSALLGWGNWSNNTSSSSFEGSGFGNMSSNFSKKSVVDRLYEALQFTLPQNYARAQVGELPLIWDPKVEAYAQWWAEQRKADCNMIHSHGPFGENIFWGSGTAWAPLDAVKFWVDEKYYYDYKTNSCISQDAMCGHYTQIVWRDSRRLGCARVACDNGDVFMTCNYDPPGNYIGEKPY